MSNASSAETYIRKALEIAKRQGDEERIALYQGLLYLCAAMKDLEQQVHKIKSRV